MLGIMTMLFVHKKNHKIIAIYLLKYVGND